MGEAFIKGLASMNCGHTCESCAKYVCNACRFHSKCCACVEVEIVTEEIDPFPDHVSEVSLSVDDCCAFHSKT